MNVLIPSPMFGQAERTFSGSRWKLGEGHPSSTKHFLRPGLCWVLRQGFAFDFTHNGEGQVCYYSTSGALLLVYSRVKYVSCEGKMLEVSSDCPGLHRNPSQRGLHDIFVRLHVHEVHMILSLLDFCVSFSVRLYETPLWSSLGSSTPMASLFSKKKDTTNFDA